jgi:hypothetical protein
MKGNKETEEMKNSNHNKEQINKTKEENKQ